MKMNEHTSIADLLPLYVSGALNYEQRQTVEQHLPTCAECQADLVLWQAVSGEIVSDDQAVRAPWGVTERALAQVGRRQPASATSAGLYGKLGRAGLLLRSQMALVQREIWPASALVIGLGYIAALISAHAGFVYALAPLMAATCVSLIYGPENDPAYELALATPTSPRQILLARLVLVFGYNLVLVLVATLGLLPLLAASGGQPLFGNLLLSWLAPMTFLSASALLLSLWIGAPNAISITYLAWLAQLLVGPLRSPQAGLKLSPLIADMLAAYQSYWQAPLLLLALSVPLFAVAIWLAGSREQSLLNPA